MTERLDVYLCDRLAGALERTNGRISFRYLADYLESESPAVVSSTLPLSERVYKERDVMAFFSNLLPVDDSGNSSQRNPGFSGNICHGCPGFFF